MTYNQFQQSCAEAWRTEGQGSSDTQQAHKYLRRVAPALPTKATKGQVISAAWREYKKDNS